MMYAILACDALAAVTWFLAVLSGIACFFARPARLAAWLLGGGTGLLGLLALAGGVVGWQLACAQVDAVLPLADPSQREILERVGYAEADNALWFGLASAIVLVGGAVIPVGLGFGAKKAPESDL